MTDLLIKLFDMFNAVAKAGFSYIPHSKEDLLGIFRYFWDLIVRLNGWVASVLGVDIQKIINIFAEFVIKHSSLAFNFLMELIKKMTESV